METTREIIRKRRKERMLSFRQAAKLTGLSPAYIKLAEDGKRGIGPESMEKFSKIFGPLPCPVCGRGD